MKLRWFTLILLLLAVPSIPLARWVAQDVVMESEATGPVVFSHENHLQYVGRNCPTCHNDIFNIDVSKNPEFTMDQMEKGQSCGACHNGERAFGVGDACSACHPTRQITFEVAGIGKVDFSHDVHTSMFGCSECHPDLFVPGGDNPSASMADMSQGQSCGACHDGSMAFSVEANCDVCHQM